MGGLFGGGSNIDIDPTPPPDPSLASHEANVIQKRTRKSQQAALARLGGTGRSQLSVPGLFAPFRRRR